MNYDLHQVLEVARLHYVAKLSQQEIAERLGLSRPTISRLLRQAEERGVVRIAVVDPFHDLAKLESRLTKEFALKEARVVNVLGLSATKARVQLGKAAAEYLVKILKPHDVLGVAWGTTTLEVARQMPQCHIEDIRVASLIGCTYENTMDEGVFEVARMFGHKLGAALFLLYTPVIVSSLEAKSVYLSENHTRRTMEYIQQANIALNGVGNFSRDSMLYRYGYISEEKRAELERKGTVGNFCSLYYDIDGKLVDNDLAERTIGASLECLRTKEHSIAVAAGREKAAAILGALRGGYINVLITDEEAAKAVLELIGDKPKRAKAVPEGKPGKRARTGKADKADKVDGSGPDSGGDARE